MTDQSKSISCADAPRLAGSLPGRLAQVAMRLVGLVRDARWVTRRTLIVGGAATAILFTIILVGSYSERTTLGFTDLDGNTLGDDFILFWAGTHLAAQGHAASAYEPAMFQAFGQAVTGPFGTYRIYVYPPIAMLLSLPLALVSFIPGLVLWLLAGSALFVCLLRRLVGWGMATLALVAAPCSFLNLLAGQNGYYSAGLLCGGLMLLERNPIFAGVCFGCLAYKPQLAILVPFALAAGGRWRAFAAAAATVALLLAASVALFGTAPWSNFFAHAELQRHLLELLRRFWQRMSSVFVVARLIGLPIGAAYTAQLCSGALALAAVVALWRSAASIEVKRAGLIIATFLATPHLWDYDQIALLFAAAWLAAEGKRSGFLAWERLAILALILLPALRTKPGLVHGVPLAPFVLWPMLVALFRQRRRSVSCRAVLSDGKVGPSVPALS